MDLKHNRSEIMSEKLILVPIYFAFLILRFA